MKIWCTGVSRLDYMSAHHLCVELFLSTTEQAMCCLSFNNSGLCHLLGSEEENIIMECLLENPKMYFNELQRKLYQSVDVLVFQPFVILYTI